MECHTALRCRRTAAAVVPSTDRNKKTDRDQSNQNLRVDRLSSTGFAEGTVLLKKISKLSKNRYFKTRTIIYFKNFIFGLVLNSKYRKKKF